MPCFAGKGIWSLLHLLLLLRNQSRTRSLDRHATEGDPHATFGGSIYTSGIFVDKITVGFPVDSIRREKYLGTAMKILTDEGNRKGQFPLVSSGKFDS